MSFASNLSAFGMKPASTTTNTPATGTSIFGQPAKSGGSIFGNTQQQQQPTTSLFGNTNNTATTNTNPLFGGGNTGGSIFGQQNQPNQQQQQQQPAGGTSLFGQSIQQPATGGTGLFGQPAQQQQSTTGTSLFGQPAQQSNAGTAATAGTGTGTGLFGQSTGGSLFGQPAQQQSQPSTGTGLFGQSQQQPSTGPGLFGQQAAGASNIFGQSQQQSAGLFGQQPQQQQQQQPGLFGGPSSFGNTNNNTTATSSGGAGLFGSTANNNSAGASSFGGNTLFGQKPAQQSTLGLSTAPAGPPPFTKTTKFNDLPDDIKRTLEQIDSHIQGRIQISKDLRQKKLGEEPTKGQELIRAVHKDLTQTSNTIRNDLHFTRDLKAKADQAAQDTIIATRIVDGFRNSQNSGYLKDHASFPLEFFTRVTNQIRERLVWYKATIDQIERKLSSMTNQTHVTPQGITATLQAQHSIFLSLASKTAALDAELQKIKALYTQLWRARTGSVRDPFEGSVDEDGIGGSTGLGMSMSGLSVGS